MFQIGDAVVHPAQGAGVVTDIEEFRRRGQDKSYYKIELTSPPRTSVMVPVDDAQAHGVREAVSGSRLKRVWCVLTGSPQMLPNDFATRRDAIKDKLSSGKIRQVAEALRDLAWRRRQEGRLTTTERRLYRKGMNVLAEEIAVARGIDLEAVKLQVGKRINEALTRHQGSDVN